MNKINELIEKRYEKKEQKRNKFYNMTISELKDVRISLSHEMTCTVLLFTTIAIAAITIVGYPVVTFLALLGLSATFSNIVATFLKDDKTKDRIKTLQLIEDIENGKVDEEPKKKSKKTKKTKKIKGSKIKKANKKVKKVVVEQDIFENYNNLSREAQIELLKACKECINSEKVITEETKNKSLIKK